MKFIQFLLVFCFFSKLAVGQEISETCPEQPMDDESARVLAKMWFDRGNNLVESHKYREAAKAYLCSNMMVEHPSTLYNSARAARLGGDLANALELFRAVEMLSPDEDTSGEVAEQIAELEELVGESEEMASVQVPVEIPEEEAEPEPEPMMQQKPQPAVTPPKEDAGGEQRSALAPTGWATLIGGGAGLVLGAVFQGLAGKAKSDAESTQNGHDFEDYQNKIKTFQKGALAGFIAGGVLAGAGITMIVLSRSDKRQNEQASLIVGYNSITIVGSF